jgi:hypothetical protein
MLMSQLDGGVASGAVVYLTAKPGNAKRLLTERYICLVYGKQLEAHCWHEQNGTQPWATINLLCYSVSIRAAILESLVLADSCSIAPATAYMYAQSSPS